MAFVQPPAPLINAMAPPPIPADVVATPSEIGNIQGYIRYLSSVQDFPEKAESVGLWTSYLHALVGPAGGGGAAAAGGAGEAAIMAAIANLNAQFANLNAQFQPGGMVHALQGQLHALQGQVEATNGHFQPGGMIPNLVEEVRTTNRNMAILANNHSLVRYDHP